MAKSIKNKTTVIDEQLIPMISDDHTRCIIGDLTLVVNSTIDYKKSDELRASVGTIRGFMYAGERQSDKSSAWMNVQDMSDKQNQTEWISVNVWYDQYQNGLFNTKQIANDNDSQPAITGKRPF